MKKKKIVAVTVLAIASAAVFLTVRHFSKPILIGAVLPIDTSLGNEENLFIRYWQDRHPKIGLRTVKFVIENPVSKEEEFKEAYRKLREEGVCAIIGGVLSRDGVWLAQEAAGSGIPTFGLTPSSAVLSGKKDSFFRLCATNALQAKAVGMYYQRIGVKKLVLVTSVENTVYVEPYIRAVAEDFKGEMMQIPFSPEDRTWEKIFSASPEGIFTILPAKDVIQVVKTARERNPDILLGSSSWGSVEILSLYSGPLLDGVLFFTLGAELHGEEYKADIADFEQKYRMKATNGSHYAISVCRILYDAVRTVGSSREGLKLWFETPRIYDTIYGKIAMDEYGDAYNSRIIILETVNGAMTKKETVELK